MVQYCLPRRSVLYTPLISSPIALIVVCPIHAIRPRAGSSLSLAEQMKPITIAALLMILCGCYSSRLILGSEYTPISPYAIIGNGLQYDGKQVFVVGIINFTFEDYALYADQFSFNNKINENSIYLDFNGCDISNIDYFAVKSMKGKLAVIGGEYRYIQVGHGANNTAGEIIIKSVKEY